MNSRVTLFDLADALGISIGTVHRALHDHAGVSPITKTKVLQMAKSLGYRPNLAARYLSSRKNFRVSVITLQGTTSFWDEIRAGISEEARATLIEDIDLDFRTHPRLGEGDEEAFEAALKAEADGIIVFPSRMHKLRPWIRRASRLHIPVICVVTDAPSTSRLAVVSIDALASGSLAADLMGRFLRGRGKLAVTLSDLAITEHAEKYAAFEKTIRSVYPRMEVLKPIEEHDLEFEAYKKSRKLFAAHPDLAGIYVTTEASMPVIKAAQDLKILDKLTIIATDLFPAIVEEIRSGAVAATIYQRPRTQGRMAFRVLREFLTEGQCSSYQVTLAPHLVMRGNLEFFLSRQAGETIADKAIELRTAAADLGERFA
ncbi:MAG TPA: LacI family DNA-binding transcriptional regulator [Candidatus Aquilonibacter sp.]|nr:LacI family DNA-binding transcriptional regulator [Candidatus Aquilonibacter sp.]